MGAVGVIFAGALVYSLGYLLQLWNSRRREFVADEAAVALTGTGALADALAKIEQASWDTKSGKALAEKKPEFSHMYISSHSDRKSGFFGFISKLLKSHPQTHEPRRPSVKLCRRLDLLLNCQSPSRKWDCDASIEYGIEHGIHELAGYRFRRAHFRSK